MHSNHCTVVAKRHARGALKHADAWSLALLCAQLVWHAHSGGNIIRELLCT